MFLKLTRIDRVYTNFAKQNSFLGIKEASSTAYRFKKKEYEMCSQITAKLVVRYLQKYYCYLPN